MKKIIAAFDGLKYSTSTCNYALLITRQINAHLVGVFLDDKTHWGYKLQDVISRKVPTESKIKKLEAADKLTRDTAAKSFERACQKEKLEFTIHHDRNIAVRELQHESVYADLLIVNATETLTVFPEKPPTRFIRDLLGDVQCPVLIVPHNYNPIQRIIFLFNGEPSSMFSIKMFSYLMPQLKHLEIEVLSVNPVNGSLHLHDNKLMKEYMKRHYPAAKYTVLKGLPEIEIVKYLLKQSPGTLVVLGSLRRSAISRMIWECMTDVLMKETELPLFVAYND